MTIENNVHLPNRPESTSEHNGFCFRSIERNFVGIKPCTQTRIPGKSPPLVNSPPPPGEFPPSEFPPGEFPPGKLPPGKFPLVNSHPYIFTCSYPILGFEIIEFYKIEIFL